MTKTKARLALDKLVNDVKEEKFLWNEHYTCTNAEEDEAWNRVGAKNLLAGNEAKSIFRVLCKKYYQEKQKPSTSWQLYKYLQFLDENEKPIEDNEEIPDIKEEVPTKELDSNCGRSTNNEDETFVELLEVKEEEFSDDGGNISFEEEAYEDETNNKNGSIYSKDTKNNKTETASRKSSPSLLENSQIHNLSQQNNNSSNHIKMGDRIPTLQKEKDLKRKILSLTAETNNHQNDNDHKDSYDYEFQGKRRLLKSLAGNNSKSSVPIVSGSNSSPQQKSQKQSKPLMTSKDVIISTLANVSNIQSSSSSPSSSTSSSSSITPSLLQLQNKKKPKLNSAIINSSKINDEKPLTSQQELTANGTYKSHIYDTNDSTTTDPHGKYNSFGNYVAATMNRLQPNLAVKLEIKILQALIEIQSKTTAN